MSKFVAVSLFLIILLHVMPSDLAEKDSVSNLEKGKVESVEGENGEDVELEKDEVEDEGTMHPGYFVQNWKYQRVQAFFQNQFSPLFYSRYARSFRKIVDGKELLKIVKFSNLDSLIERLGMGQEDARHFLKVCNNKIDDKGKFVWNGIREQNEIKLRNIVLFSLLLVEGMVCILFCIVAYDTWKGNSSNLSVFENFYLHIIAWYQFRPSYTSSLITFSSLSACYIGILYAFRSYLTL